MQEKHNPQRKGKKAAVLAALFIFSLTLLGTASATPITKITVSQNTNLMATVNGVCTRQFFYPYLKFDVSGIRSSCQGKTITKANLQMFNIGDYTSGAGESFNVYYVSSPSSDNLNTMPVTTLWYRPLLYQTSVVLPDTNPSFYVWDSIDVTKILKSTSGSTVFLTLRKTGVPIYTPSTRYPAGLMSGVYVSGCPYLLSNFRAWTSAALLTVTCS